jgi:hypothetical protein
VVVGADFVGGHRIVDQMKLATAVVGAAPVHAVRVLKAVGGGGTGNACTTQSQKRCDAERGANTLDHLGFPLKS